MDPQQEKILEKYIKISKLAESGVAGERANAKAIADKMKKTHPWVHAAFEQRKREESPPEQGPMPEPRHQKGSTQERSAPPPPDPEPPQRGAPSPGRSGGRTGEPVVDWEKIFKFAKDVYAQAEDFVDTVSQAELAKEMAGAARVKSKLTSAGNLNILVSIPPEVLDELTSMNYLQLVAFRNALIQRFTQELDEVLDLGESE